MKIQKIEVKNIGKVEHEVVNISKSLNLFYGDVKAGKSTLAINSFRLLFGKGFPEDIIRHGEVEGEVTATFDTGVISRSFYVNKAGKTVGRPLVFTQDGKPVLRPTEKLAEMINPFLLDQDVLARKSGVERTRFLLETFCVDTSELDKKISTASTEASQMRTTIKAIGEIDTTPIEKVDTEKMSVELKRIRDEYDVLNQKYYDKRQEIVNKNNEAENNYRKHIELREKAQEKMIICSDKYRALKAEIVKLEAECVELIEIKDKAERWLDENPEVKTELLPEPERPIRPDTSELEETLSNAKAENVRYEQYLKRIEDAKMLSLKKDNLRKKEREIAELRQEKTALLASISADSGVKELEFDEEGNFRFQNTTPDMLSTSQIMELSSRISATLPNDLGLELIDRAESLGKSIFGYIDRAKAEEKTILATIVGEKPAEISEDIGVFVVEDGKVK